jgi:hypothetical protein
VVDDGSADATTEVVHQLAELGVHHEAIRAYELARSHALPGDKMSELLTRQIDRIATALHEMVPPLRNAWRE